MEFLLTILVTAAFFGAGLAARKYTKGVRMVLVILAATAPVLFLAIWR